ncbi:MAG: hypothetical protein ACO1OB_34135 [Archangium sp.]
MTCEEVELELSGGTSSPEGREHLEGCAACRETSRLFGLAALPPVTDAERLMMKGLAVSTQQAWRVKSSRGGVVRRVASLAMAAGLGALVATGVMLKLRPEAEVRVQTIHVTPPEVPALEFVEANLSDDEVFFDVSWPSPTEGDL